MEGLMLKLQYFGHLMQRADSLEKTLMLGNALTLLVGMQTSTATMENSVGIP